MAEEEQDTTVHTDDSVTQDEVDWQKRFTDTQAEYTKQQQALKDEQSVWEDEQALIARIGEKFPHLIAEDEETVEDDDSSFDEPEVMTKADFEAWQTEQQQAQSLKESQDQFSRDLTRFVGQERELDQYGEAWIKSQTYKGPEDLEQAVNAWFEHLDSLGSKRKKKSPHVLQGGQVATGVPNYDEMTRDQINDAMVERARALESQT